MADSAKFQLTHKVALSDINNGDHLYTRPGLAVAKLKEGIVVPGQDRDGGAQKMIISTSALNDDGSLPQLQLLTLDEFRASRLKLRRAYYDQGDAIFHHCKLPGTSYVDRRLPSNEIVANALILYRLSQSPDVYGGQLKMLLGNKYERFAYICSTTQAKDWIFPLEFDQITVASFSDGEQNSPSIPATAQEIDSSNGEYGWSHAIEISDLKRGDHIYAWRKGILYQHHAIVIGRSDVPEENHRTHSIPIIQDLMVIENNKTESPCIRIVTLADFASNYRIRKVQYGRNSLTDMFIIDIKMRGTTHLENSLPAEDIVRNALYLYHHSNSTDPSEVRKYSFFFQNCEHFAFACSTDKTMISRLEQQNDSPDYRSQQWEAANNAVLRAATLIAWHTLEQTDAWKYLVEKLLPSMRGFSAPIIKTMMQGISWVQSLVPFLRTAGPVVGIAAAITCCLEILLLAIRYLIYVFTKGLERIKVMAVGLAIELTQFVKGVVQSIASNGLSAVFSLIGGAIGLAIPIPAFNFILSVALSIAGLALGRYLAGIPMNFYERHQCLK